MAREKLRKRLEKTSVLHLGLIPGTETAYNNPKPKTINKNDNKKQQTLGKGGRI